MCEIPPKSAVALPGCCLKRNATPPRRARPMKTTAGTGAATTVNGRPSFATDRGFGLRVSAVGFPASLVLWLVATPFVQGLKQGQLYQAGGQTK
jgi:hypothetical protein